MGLRVEPSRTHLITKLPMAPYQFHLEPKYPLGNQPKTLIYINLSYCKITLNPNCLSSSPINLSSSPSNPNSPKNLTQGGQRLFLLAINTLLGLLSHLNFHFFFIKASTLCNFIRCMLFFLVSVITFQCFDNTSLDLLLSLFSW